MRYKLLGRSGLRVSDLCLGTMTFGTEWGWGSDKAESAAVFDAFAEAGGNFVDTSCAYTEGTSETFVGEFLARDRERFVLATKYSAAVSPRVGIANAGNSMKAMRQAVDGSLKRLKTDYIDVLYLHIWDATTPIDEVMRGFHQLVTAGKVLYAAFSDTPAWIVSQANAYADLHGLTPAIAYQAEYNLIERTAERDILPMAQALGLGVTAWSPLAGGLLTGKYEDGGARGRNRAAEGGPMVKVVPATAPADQRERAILDELQSIATETGATPAQVALAWLINRPSQVIPIFGARTAEQVKCNVASADLALDGQQLARLSDASAITYGFPHEFLLDKQPRAHVFAGHPELVVNDRALDYPPPEAARLREVPGSSAEAAG